MSDNVSTIVNKDLENILLRELERNETCEYGNGNIVVAKEANGMYVVTHYSDTEYFYLNKEDAIASLFVDDEDSIPYFYSTLLGDISSSLYDAATHTYDGMKLRPVFEETVHIKTGQQVFIDTPEGDCWSSLKPNPLMEQILKEKRIIEHYEHLLETLGIKDNTDKNRDISPSIRI